MKKVFFCFLFFNTSYGQSMSTLFRQLPLECTPELSYKERDSLLRNQKYTIPGGDTVETTMYSIDTSQSKDYLRYEYTFITGQSGFIVFELRRLKKENGKTFIVFSRYGGTTYSFSQHELRVFDIINYSLKENKTQTLLPKVVEINTLLKNQTPDNIKSNINESISSSYDLYPSLENQIFWRISSNYPSENEEWTVRNQLVFSWDGNRFNTEITNK